MIPQIIPDSRVQLHTPHPHLTSQNQDVQNGIPDLLPDIYSTHSLLDCCIFPVAQIPNLEVTLNAMSTCPIHELIRWLNHQYLHYLHPFPSCPSHHHLVPGSLQLPPHSSPSVHPSSSTFSTLQPERVLSNIQQLQPFCSKPSSLLSVKPKVLKLAPRDGATLVTPVTTIPTLGCPGAPSWSSTSCTFLPQRLCSGCSF